MDKAIVCLHRNRTVSVSNLINNTNLFKKMFQVLLCQQKILNQHNIKESYRIFSYPL